MNFQNIGKYLAATAVVVTLTTSAFAQQNNVFITDSNKNIKNVVSTPDSVIGNVKVSFYCGYVYLFTSDYCVTPQSVAPTTPINNTPTTPTPSFEVNLPTGTTNPAPGTTGSFQPTSGGTTIVQPKEVVYQVIERAVPGPQGPAGPQGPQGAQGPAGVSGTSGTVYSGSPAYYSNAVTGGSYNGAVSPNPTFVSVNTGTLSSGAINSGSISTGNLTASGTTMLATTTITSLNAGAVSISNVTASNTVSDNIVATNATITNSTSTNFFSNFLSALTASLTNLLFGNATGTNITATGTADLANIVNNTLTSNTATITNLTGTNSTFANSTTTNSNWINATGTNTYTQNLTANNATLTNLVSSNSLTGSTTATSLNVTGSSTLASTSINGTLALNPVASGTAAQPILVRDPITGEVKQISASEMLASNTTNVLSYTGGASNTMQSTVNGVVSTTSINQLNAINLTGTTTSENIVNSGNFLTNFLSAALASITNLLFGNATGTNITATGTANLANMVGTNATITSATITNLNSTNSILGAATATSLNVTGDTNLGTTTIAGPLTATNTTLNGTTTFNGVVDLSNASVTMPSNATFTNIVWGNATGTNLSTTNSTSTNFFSNFLSALTASITNLLFGNATGTNITATGTADLANIVNNTLTSNTATITNLTGTNSTFANSTTTNSNWINATGTNTYTQNLTANNATLTNLVSSNSLTGSTTATSLNVTGSSTLASTSINGTLALNPVASGTAAQPILVRDPITGEVKQISASEMLASNTTNVLSYTGGASNTMQSTVNGVVSTTSINQLNAINLTGTTTSENIVNSGNFLTNFLSAALASITNLLFGNATGTNITATGTANLATVVATNTTSTNLSATNATTTNLVGTNATFTNLSVPVSATTSGNVLTTNVAGSIATTSLITGNTLSYTGGASNTLSSTINGVISTTSINTLNNLTLTGTTTAATLTAQQVDTTGLTATNATITNLTITNLLCNIGWNFFCDEGNTRGKILTLGTNDNYALNFETNNVTDMTLATNGYLGLGTTTPTSYITAVASTSRPLLTMGASSTVNTGNYSAVIGGNATNTGAYSLMTGLDNDSSALYAATFGRLNTHATGTYSLLSGYLSTSSATYSITAGDRLRDLGSYNALFGTRNTLSALASLGFGFQNYATSSNYSLIGGANSTSSASSYGVMVGSNLYATGSNYSATFGSSNFVNFNADGAITSGYNNYNDGFTSIMGGHTSTNTANYSVVSGYLLDNSGTYSAVFGTENNNSGPFSIVGGWLATNTGSYNLVNGYGLMSSGSASIVTGLDNTNLENYSSVSGLDNMNSGAASLVYGAHATNTGGYSAVGGSYNQNSGLYANVGGVYNNNLADYGFVQGYDNTNRSFLATYFGRYAEDATAASSTAWVTSDPLFVVSNGTGTTTRANAITLLKNGNLGIGTSTPGNALHISSSTGAISGLRLGITSASATTTGNGKGLSVNANGDVILVDAGGAITNTSSFSTTTNQLVTTVGGVSATATISGLNNASMTGTTTISGILDFTAAAWDALWAKITASTTNTIAYSTSTSLLTSTVNGKVATTTISGGGTNVSIAEGLLAYATGGQSAANAVATQVTAYNTPVNNDFGAGAFSGGTFTVPAGKAGWYTISGTYINSNITGGSINQVYITVNGSAVTRSINSPVGMGNQVWPSVTLSKYLNAGDTVALNVVQTSGGTISISSATNLSLVRLGSTQANSFTLDYSTTTNTLTGNVGGMIATTSIVSGSGSANLAFSAHRNGVAQAYVDGTLTKVQYTTEDFDTNSNYDNATNYRFQPTVAGKYILTGSAYICINAAGYGETYIRKNGTTNIAQDRHGNASGGVQCTFSPASAVVDANGTTDYFEVFIRTSGGTGNIFDINGGTKFTGALISGGSGSGSITNSLTYSTSTSLLTSNVSGVVATTSLVTSSSAAPAFSAGRTTSNQIVASNVITLVDWNLENFDTTNNFDPATDRFTPTTAGKYHITASLQCQDATASCTVYVRKNGTIIHAGQSTINGSVVGVANLDNLIEMNGTTDYLDVVVNNSGGTNVTGSPVVTYFSGSLVGGISSAPWSQVTSTFAYTMSDLSVGSSTSASTKMQVFGDIRVGTSGTNGCIQRFDGTALTGTCSSDETLKTNITDLNMASITEKIANLRFVSYSWNDLAAEKYNKATTTTAYGVLAQNVEANFPELVSTDDQGYKVVDLSTLQWYLMAAVKEVLGKIDNIIDTLINHEDRIRAIEERLQMQGVESNLESLTSTPEQTSTTSDTLVDWSDPTSTSTPEATSTLSCQAGTQYDSTTNSCVAIPSTTETPTTTDSTTTTPTVEPTPEPTPTTEPTSEPTTEPAPEPTPEPTPVIDPAPAPEPTPAPADPVVTETAPVQ